MSNPRGSVADLFNKESSYGKLPYDNNVISKAVTWGNIAIYSLTIVATVWFMLDTTDCFYLGLLNGVVEIIGVTFLLVSELPMWSIPPTLDAKLRDFMGFLYKPIGRLCFVLYVSFILFGFGTFGSLMAVLMLVSTLFSVYLYFKHPTTRELYHNLDKPTDAHVNNST